MRLVCRKCRLGTLTCTLNKFPPQGGFLVGHELMATSSGWPRSGTLAGHEKLSGKNLIHLACALATRSRPSADVLDIYHKQWDNTLMKDKLTWYCAKRGCHLEVSENYSGYCDTHAKERETELYNFYRNSLNIEHFRAIEMASLAIKK